MMEPNNTSSSPVDLSSGGLRRRNVGAQDGVLNDDSENKSKNPMLRKFTESVDLFPKPKEDFQRKQTRLGAAVSWVGFTIIALFVFIELVSYVVGWDAYTSQLSVDMGISAKVPVNFDLTFYHIQCHHLTLDAMDASGGEENDVAHDLFKSPVDARGHLLFVGKYNYVETKLGKDGTPVGPAYDASRDPKSPKFCGKCYISPQNHHHGWDRPGGLVDSHFNSEKHKNRCCNTCQSVMEMYDQHGVPRPHINEVEQCITELSHAHPGCNIRGQMELRKVKGNFHFAPGTTINLGPFGQHIHQFGIEELLSFNISHRINHFSIGDKNIHRFSKRGVKYPLDGMNYIVQKGLAQMKYFIQVVPTVYQNGATPPTVYDQATGAVTTAVPDSSFEFAATYHHKEFSPMMGMSGMNPSLFFVFDFYPIQVTQVFQRQPFYRFLVRLCPIVGGVFVMMGLLDTGVAGLVRKYPQLATVMDTAVAATAAAGHGQ